MVDHITLDVLCFQPNWVFEPHNKKYSKPAYRIYIDGHLLIERTWVWGGHQYVTENLLVELHKENTSHHLKLEPVLLNPAQAKFNLFNPTFNGRSMPLNWRDDFFLEISFDT